MHRTLTRQLRRLGIDNNTYPEQSQWGHFLKMVENVYEGADRDRYLSERSLEISSNELMELNKQLSKASRLSNDANNAKSQFLANMSHELRSPLNAIIGFSELILEEYNNLEEDEVLLDVERIHSSARYLLVIINDILDLSKIEAGKTELMLDNFALTDLLMDVKSMVQPMIDKNANHFILDHDNNLYNVLWDELKVRQIIINLISNSAKFTKNGKIILEVKNYIEKNEKYILMKVIDTGIGMSSGEIENIFSPFIQAKSSSFVEQKGTGLGLSITKKYCEMMNGTVSCESILDKGTTFTIKIPTIIDRRKPVKARRKNDQ